jgi:hypothetical protein
MSAVFSEQEQTVRKWWLRILLFQATLMLFSSVYRFPFPESVDIHGAPLNMPFYLSLIENFLVCLGVLFAWCYGSYYCAYQRQGTKLLTLSLVFKWVRFITLGYIILAVLSSIATGNRTLFSLFSTDCSIGEYMIALLGVAILFPDYIFTVRLRRINRARKETLPIETT